jgi:hypothetical protein
VVVDAAGYQYEEAPIEVDAGARFDASVTLEPGESVRGFVVFLLPDGVAPVKFQMSLDYGFSPTWAEFDVG